MTATTILQTNKNTYQWRVSLDQESKKPHKNIFVSMKVNSHKPKFYGSSIGLKSGEQKAIIKALKNGFPISSFETLHKKMGIQSKKLAETINIASRTLTRRKKEGCFKTDESERLLRIARLFDRTADVLGGSDKARLWLLSPKKALDNLTPLEYAVTEPGAQEVSDLLGRIEHGVFS